MKRKPASLLAISLILCLSFGTVQAATIISLLPASPSVTLGDQILINVVLSTDTPFLSGALDFGYPTGLVSLANFAFGAAVDSGFSFLPNTSTAGQINDFAFSNFSGISGASNLLATMAFNTIGIGTSDFTVAIDQTSQGGWFFLTGVPLTASDFSNFTLNNASVQINAVPIPGALWLLGSGLVGLVVMKRRKKA